MSRPAPEAFSAGRALAHGVATLRVAAGPLLLGGLLMQCSGGGGGAGATNLSEIRNSWPGLSRGTGTGPGGLAEATVDRVAALGAAQPLDALTDLMSGGGLLGVIVLAGLCVLLCSLAVFAFRSWLLPGYLRVQDQALTRGAGGLDVLFGGSDAFLRMVGWQLLTGFIGFGVAIVVSLPAVVLLVLGLEDRPTLTIVLLALLLPVLVAALLYVQLGFWFGTRLVALDGVGVLGALDRSWELASGHRLRILWFTFLTWLPFVAGFMVIGVVATLLTLVLPLGEGSLALLGLGLPLASLVYLVPARVVAEAAATDAFLLFTRDDAEIAGYHSMRES